MLEVYQDGVEVQCLPDCAKCKADEKERSPLDLDECPLGYANCEGNCFCYTEE